MENPSRKAHLSFERPLVTVDLVIFTVHQEQLRVLLVQRPAQPREPFPEAWALPGGCVDVQQDKTLLGCARRQLKEKTGVATPYLEQLGSWGSATRDPRGWSVTQAYLALVPMPAGKERETGGGAVQQWVPLDAALKRRLAFDHAQILEAAVARLRSKVEYTSLPAFLVPEPLTLPQLQHTYEIVLGRTLDKSAFRKRMLDAEFLEEAEMVTGPGGRPAQGYRIVDRSSPAIFPRTFKSGE